MNTLLKIGAVVAVLAVVWWIIASVGPSDAEAVAVAKEQARVAQEAAAVEARRVAALEVELADARAEAQRVDTVFRTVLRNPPPVRPVTPTGPALDSLPLDSVKALLAVSVAYGDTVTQDNRMLRAALDTTLRVNARYRLAADSTIGAQARQIAAQNQQITAMQTIIDVQQCRMLRYIPCPSRKVVAVGAAGVTYLVSRSLNR